MIDGQHLRDDADSHSPILSVIVTCFNEESTIGRFHERLTHALERVDIATEIFFINDGSTDQTLSELGRIFERDSRVSAVVDLFRNSGQRAAITAGLNLCRGRVVLMIDSDLQLDPEELPLLYAEYKNGHDVVAGYRKDRRDSFWRIAPSKLANMIMRRVSKTKLRDFGCTFKLYDARLLRAFAYGPQKVFDPAMTLAQARRIAEVPVSHHPRPHGKSGWTFRKLWEFNMDNLVNLSHKPFQLLAAFCFALAVVFVVRIAAAFFVDFSVIEEVTTGLLLNVVVVSLLVVASILALIGEFVIRVFSATQDKPQYIVRTVRRR